MNILFYSTEDGASSGGGASKAAHRLHTCLQASGHQSTMMVRYKQADDPTIVTAEAIWPSRGQQVLGLMTKIIKKQAHATYRFNFDRADNIPLRNLLPLPQGAVDIICLNWITDLLTTRLVEQIAHYYSCPVVWVMMDQEPVTGGCHYSFGCRGFTGQCGNCPQLRPHSKNDVSHRLWQSKRDHLTSLPLSFVAPTRWVHNKIRESSLFSSHRIADIPLSIDDTVFKPRSRQLARELLNVPPHSKVIFFGAWSFDDPRKGISKLYEALDYVKAHLSGKDAENVVLLSAGRRGGERRAFPFPVVHLGFIRDDLTLALAYQAADIFVNPTIEDAGPMMISEAMMCGVPVVSFDTGGAADVVRPGETGYLAKAGDSIDLGRGICSLVESGERERMGQAAHRFCAARHSPRVVAEQHAAFYSELVKN
jgi:glycosyltransferase involved in cell wall biosynthesis